MVIATTYLNGDIFPHFGKTPELAVYLIEDGKEIVRKNVVSVEGPGHESIAYMLMDLDVDILLCGGVGMGAINALASVGIEVYPGCSGDADKVVNDFLLGKLEQIEGPTCSCHETEHECHCHDEEQCECDDDQACCCHNK